MEVLEEEISALRNMKNGSSGDATAAKEAELRAALKKSHEDIVCHNGAYFYYIF